MTRLNVFRAAALALVATLATATAIHAADPQSAGDRAHRWESRLQQKLGLTDDQLQALRQVYAARDVDAQRQQHRARRAAEAELRRLALNGADDATLKAKQADVQTLLAQSMQARLETLKQVGPILNPDQREAFARMLERGRHGHHHRGQPAQPRG
jgi:Spy/CpxP family protein refolding chaperone